ncbi:MAG: DEAD/DEAH box helicase [Pseudomonadota bacterium]
MTEFEALGLHPTLLKTIADLGFDAPTPIQRQAIPLALEGRDVLGLAQTGTGKTAAFGLPLIQGLLEARERPEPRAARSLILAPTRELANQIADNLRAFAGGAKIRVVVVVGGASINNQVRALERGTDILVATPGRLLDLVERRAVALDRARVLVLDEADQMLDLGFIHALRRIAKLLGTPRHTMLFSATMPKNIEELGGAYLSDPVRVEATPPGKAADKIEQSVLFLESADKPAALITRLDALRKERALVFARTKRGAERLSKRLAADGFAAASIHGNKSQNQRDRAIAGFRSGEIRVLVATDVAARGIDIPGVAAVFNYELPDTPDNYVHRIGRTARAGADGAAIAFCAPEEAILLRDIERLMRIEIASADGAPRPDWALRPRPAPKPGKSRAGGAGQRGAGPRGAGQRSAKPGGSKPSGQKPAGSSKPRSSPDGRSRPSEPSGRPGPRNAAPRPNDGGRAQDGPGQAGARRRRRPNRGPKAEASA